MFQNIKVMVAKDVVEDAGITGDAVEVVEAVAEDVVVAAVPETCWRDNWHELTKDEREAIRAERKKYDVGSKKGPASGSITLAQVKRLISEATLTTTKEETEVEERVIVPAGDGTAFGGREEACSGRGGRGRA